MENEAGAVPECLRIGEAMPDIAGIGILISFTIQASISLVLALWIFHLSHIGRLEIEHDEDTDEGVIERKRLEASLDVLMTGNDIQVLMGLALMITAFITSATGELDLYHLHLIYDTVSFTGVSSASALITWTFCAEKHPTASKSRYWKKTPWGGRLLTARHRATYVFALVFLALAILLGIRLNEWSTDPEAALGTCFRADGILAIPRAPHPLVDKVYVGVTAAWMLIVLLFAGFVGPARRHTLLLLAALQFPVHLYAVAALRTGNQTYLGEGDEAGGGRENENSWDFGQTTAVLLLMATVNEIGSKTASQWKFEHEFKAKKRRERREREENGRERDDQNAADQLKVAPQLEAAETPADR